MTLDVLRRQGYEVQSWFHGELVLRNQFDEVERSLTRIVQNLNASIDEVVVGGGNKSPLTRRIQNNLEQEGLNEQSFITTNLVQDIPGRRRIRQPEPLVTQQQTHKVDHVYTREFTRLDQRRSRYCSAVELEWNTKDHSTNRNFENFRMLHAMGALDVGVLICRGRNFRGVMLQELEAYANRHHLVDVPTVDARIVRLANHNIGSAKTTSPSVNAKINYDLDQGYNFAPVWAHRFFESKFGTTTTEMQNVTDLVEKGVAGTCPIVVIGLPPNAIFVNDELA